MRIRFAGRASLPLPPACTDLIRSGGCAGGGSDRCCRVDTQPSMNINALIRDSGADRESLLAEVQRVDSAVYAAIAATRAPRLDGAMRRLSTAANYSRLSLAASAVLAAAGGPRGRRAAAFGLASVAATSAAANLVVKPFGHRRRPDRAAEDVPIARHVPMPRSQSFPSGHTAAAVAFAAGAGHGVGTHPAQFRLARARPVRAVALPRIALLPGAARYQASLQTDRTGRRMGPAGRDVFFGRSFSEKRGCRSGARIRQHPDPNIGWWNR